MNKFLKSREWCPIHRSMFCTPCHKPKKQAAAKKWPKKFTPAVMRVEDPHAPKGYREICSEAERRRRKKIVIARQGGKCAGCGKEFGSWHDVQMRYIWPELDHIANSKMGAAFKDDSLDNLQALCGNDCHPEKTGLPQWGKVSA
jgi:hypothetical protein